MTKGISFYRLTKNGNANPMRYSSTLFAKNHSIMVVDPYNRVMWIFHGPNTHSETLRLAPFAIKEINEEYNFEVIEIPLEEYETKKKEILQLYRNPPDELSQFTPIKKPKTNKKIQSSPTSKNTVKPTNKGKKSVKKTQKKSRYPRMQSLQSQLFSPYGFQPNVGYEPEEETDLTEDIKTKEKRDLTEDIKTKENQNNIQNKSKETIINKSEHTDVPEDKVVNKLTESRIGKRTDIDKLKKSIPSPKVKPTKTKLPPTLIPKAIEVDTTPMIEDFQIAYYEKTGGKNYIIVEQLNEKINNMAQFNSIIGFLNEINFLLEKQADPDLARETLERELNNIIEEIFK